MLNESNLYAYQRRTIYHILDEPAVLKAGGALLALEMGLGKTVSSLTAAEQLIYRERQFNKVLVIAPKLVSEETWPNEIAKWDHLAHMKVSIIAGNAKQRIAALKRPADVYCIGRDNLQWLVGIFLGERWPFPFIIGDESTSFKNPLSGRFRALWTILPQVQKFLALTGTPAPNGLHDLWAQMYLVDRGIRLGDDYYKFYKEFFTFKETEHHTAYDFQIKEVADPLYGKNINVARIQSLISDVSISMKSRDYLDLPPRNDIYYEVHMPPGEMARYEKFKKDYVTQIGEQQINAFSAPGLYNKLLQYANGAVYDNELMQGYHVTHDAKLDMLEQIIEEAEGEPVLVFYNFQSDIDRIKKRFPKLNPKVLAKGDTGRWNRGEIPLMLMHSSGGYGLNIQDGSGIMVWFGLPWSADSYKQACARLDRQGQKRRINNYHLLCPGTLEYEVAQRLKNKIVTQDELLYALKADVYGAKREWGAPAIQPQSIQWPGVIGPPAIFF